MMNWSPTRLGHSTAMSLVSLTGSIGTTSVKSSRKPKRQWSCLTSFRPSSQDFALHFSNRESGCESERREWVARDHELHHCALSFLVMALVGLRDPLCFVRQELHRFRCRACRQCSWEGSPNALVQSSWPSQVCSAFPPLPALGIPPFRCAALLKPYLRLRHEHDVVHSHGFQTVFPSVSLLSSGGGPFPSLHRVFRSCHSRRFVFLLLFQCRRATHESPCRSPASGFSPSPPDFAGWRQHCVSHCACPAASFVSFASSCW